MSRIIALLSSKIAVHRRKIAVMSRIYCDNFGARHLIGDDYTEILLLLTTVSDDFPTVALRFFLIGSLLKKIARHIAVYRCFSQWIAVMSSQGCREIAVKTTVANATRIQRLSAVACCVRVVMSRLDNCRVWVVLLLEYRCYESDNRSIS